MNVPAEYTEARKLQKLALALFSITGIVAALLFQQYWVKILFAAFMSFFAFSLLHHVYLSLKYSFIELTTGFYSKANHPIQYWLSILMFTLGGMLFIYAAYNS